MEPFIVKKSISINAKPSQVWEALTNPKLTKKYFYHCKVESDWKKGSPITFKGKMLWIIPISMSGKIKDIENEKRLKYTLGNRGSSSFSTVTDELTYQNGITTLSVSDDVGQGEGAEKRYQRSVKGWENVLKGLKQVVEQNYR